MNTLYALENKNKTIILVTKRAPVSLFLDLKSIFFTLLLEYSCIEQVHYQVIIHCTRNPLKCHDNLKVWCTYDGCNTRQTHGYAQQKNMHTGCLQVYSYYSVFLVKVNISASINKYMSVQCIYQRRLLLFLLSPFLGSVQVQNTRILNKGGGRCGRFWNVGSAAFIGDFQSSPLVW